MQFYIESYKNGNGRHSSQDADKEKEKLVYFSERFLLIDTKLGVASDYAETIIKENMPVLKEFRSQFRPFEHPYQYRFVMEQSNQISMKPN